MKNYKIWYDPIEEKHYLKFDGENKIEVSKEQFVLLEEEIEFVAQAKREGAYPCYVLLAEKIREANNEENRNL